MNEHTQRVLEFDKIKEILANYTSSPSVKEYCLLLSPISDIEKIRVWLDEIRELEDVLRYVRPPFRDFIDIRPYMEKIEKGGMLTGIELFGVGEVFREFNKIKNFLLSHKERLPHLSKYGKEIGNFQKIIKDIHRAIGEDGELKDDASERLRVIRNSKRRLVGKIRNTLENIMRNSLYQKIVAEKLITVRNNRYVIPLKEGFSKTLPGIVHDRSGSGLTYFVEPIQVLDMNNELVKMEKEEQREKELILKRFSQIIRERIEEIDQAFRILTYINFVYVKYLFAEEYRAFYPAINSNGFIELINARHPLLGKDAVPISLKIGKDYDIVVITGPNTGGKTVSLKTIGLLTIMVQSGLFIPASPDSNIGIFPKIFADIGDEQSIEQSLSTFSSHMENIIKILREVDDKSLILLDELGAGTDPEEGAALGMAIISYLKEKGSKAVVTTHYTPLKEFAYLEDRVINASVEFDIKNLRPTYKLTIGLPGRSNAFLIAKRLGLSEDILSKAQEFLSGERLRVEDFLEEIKRYRDRSYKESEKIKKLRQSLSKLKVEKERNIREKEKEIERIREEALDFSRQIILDTGKKLNKIISKIRKDGATKEATKMARTLLKEELKKIEREKKPIPEISSFQKEENFKTGDFVEVRNLGLKGEIEKIDKDRKVVVNCNGIRITTSAKNIKKIDKPKEEVVDKGVPMSGFVEKKIKATNKLHIRKMYTEDAEPLIRKFLDDSYLLGISPIYIIHGKGQGILKNLTHEILRETPYVTRFRPGLPEEGDGGVTVVYLDI